LPRRARSLFAGRGTAPVQMSMSLVNVAVMPLREQIRDLVPPLIWRTARRALRRSPPQNKFNLNTTRRMFVQWNAERLNITFDESLARYERSWNVIEGGHGGSQFRNADTAFCDVINVLFPDTSDHLYDAYLACAPLMFLRMLSYEDPDWSKSQLLDDLAKKKDITILDFGCGLAQQSRALASALKQTGSSITLYLADIPTMRKDFLIWVGRTTGIPTHFLDCTTDTPIPALASCDVCFAQEFFEHVHNPTLYMHEFDRTLKPGGFLVTNVSDHQSEYMHVHPILDDVRKLISSLGYREIVPFTIFNR
jgi:2-polyprenyl-3-methyl-5-hydroxy-6-metoxy-1,4-benzoquinol methylase